MVTSGLVRRNARFRLLRDNIVIYTGEVNRPAREGRRREVKEGFECGIKLKNVTDIAEGDQLEFFEIKEVARNALTPPTLNTTPPSSRGGVCSRDPRPMRPKRSTPNRSFRVADQIQRDLAELIRELKDPRIGMVTLSSVEVTPDYAHARCSSRCWWATPPPRRRR